MRTDKDLEKDIREELDWEARLKESDIKLEVREGRVVLNGTVDAYPKKISAEKAIMKVAGVTAVDNELKVKIPSSVAKSDKDIEKSVSDVLRLNSSLDNSNIHVTVQDGWVSMEGRVSWEYQRSRARKVAENIAGVTGVTNLIEVSSTFGSSIDVRDRIDAALRRNYHLSSNNILVDVEGSRAILSGKVKTLAEKKEAETATWSAPGITEVVNELVVESEIEA